MIEVAIGRIFVYFLFFARNVNWTMGLRSSSDIATLEITADETVDTAHVQSNLECSRRLNSLYKLKELRRKNGKLILIFLIRDHPKKVFQGHFRII